MLHFLFNPSQTNFFYPLQLCQISEGPSHPFKKVGVALGKATWFNTKYLLIKDQLINWSFLCCHLVFWITQSFLKNNFGNVNDWGLLKSPVFKLAQLLNYQVKCRVGTKYCKVIWGNCKSHRVAPNHGWVSSLKSLGNLFRICPKKAFTNACLH